MSNLSEMEVKDILRYKNILAAIIIVVIFWFIGKNIIAGYNQKMQSLSEKKKEKQEYKQMADQYSKLNSQYASLAQKYFQGDEIDFKNYVEVLASEKSLQLEALRPIQKSGRFYKINKLAVDMKGLYSGFVQFIKELEENNIKIKTLTMEQREQGIYVKLDIEVISLK
jgi:cell division protein FtsL